MVSLRQAEQRNDANAGDVVRRDIQGTRMNANGKKKNARTWGVDATNEVRGNDDMYERFREHGMDAKGGWAGWDAIKEFEASDGGYVEYFDFLSRR